MVTTMLFRSLPRTAGAAPGLGLLLGLLGCGGEEPPPPPRRPTAIVVTAGDNQQAPVGTELPVPVTFRVSDARGPMPGVTVTFGLGDGTGFVSAPSAATGPDGQVSVRWTVGGTVGSQSLTGAVPDLPAATARATVTTGAAALVSPITAPSQFVVVGRVVPIAPAVRVTDAFGNPVAGEAVSFFDLTGRSTIVGGEATTNEAGMAGVQSWRIANQAGSYSLSAAIESGAAATFVAVGIPALVQVAAGNHQEANAGTEVAVRPAVLALDDAGQPVPGVAVSFRVTGGGGRVLGSGAVSTDGAGRAEAGSWVLGPVPGPNQLEAQIAGLAAVPFSANGLAAVPAQAQALGPTTGAGFLGNYFAPTPAIRVTDARGQPVAGVPVSFTVAAGGGMLTRPAPVTDFRGEAALGAWRLGPSGSSQAVSATAAGLPPVAFVVAGSAPPAPGFDIEIRFIGSAPTETQRAAFTGAAARWERVILGDVEDIPFTPQDDLSFCGGQTLDETIDDVLIFATIERIDGPGSILGQAGWCYARDTDLLPIVGRMVFDVDDVVALETAGRFQDVVLHEMGHVLGVGALWDLKGLITGRGGGDPFFTGPAARAAFIAADPNLTFGGSIVPVENTGGPGTRDVHWREAVARNELMTGFLNAGTNPLSAITAASLRDQGYVVNDAAADDFTLLAALQRLSPVAVALVERPWTEPIRTKDRRGTVRRMFLPTAGPYRR